MNLQQKVEHLKAKYAELTKENPEIINLDFSVQDIPVEELKAYAKENKLTLEYNAHHCAIRATIYTEANFLGQIILISKKVRVERPIIAEYDLVEA